MISGCTPAIWTENTRGTDSINDAGAGTWNAMCSCGMNCSSPIAVNNTPADANNGQMPARSPWTLARLNSQPAAPPAVIEASSETTNAAGMNTGPNVEIHEATIAETMAPAR